MRAAKGLVPAHVREGDVGRVGSAVEQSHRHETTVRRGCRVSLGPQVGVEACWARLPSMNFFTCAKHRTTIFSRRFFGCEVGSPPQHRRTHRRTLWRTLRRTRSRRRSHRRPLRRTLRRTLWRALRRTVHWPYVSQSWLGANQRKRSSPSNGLHSLARELGERCMRKLACPFPVKTGTL